MTTNAFHKLPLRHEFADLIPDDFGAAGPEIADLQARLILGESCRTGTRATKPKRTIECVNPPKAGASLGGGRAIVVGAALCAVAYLGISPHQILHIRELEDRATAAVAIGVDRLGGSFP